MADDQLFAALLALVPLAICFAGLICAVLALVSAKRNTYPSVAGMSLFGIATNAILLSVSAYAMFVFGIGGGR
jgi:ABC-type enterobactin transport system permease subunit